MASQVRTALYRFFNSAGTLLYVGIATDPEVRWQQHQRTAADTWSPLVNRQTVDWHDDRPSAEKAEAEAIKLEKPLYNVQHSNSFGPELRSALADKDDRKRAGLANLAGSGTQGPEYLVLAESFQRDIEEGRLRPGLCLPSASFCQSEYGITATTWKNACSALVAAGWVERKAGRGYEVLHPDDRKVIIPAGRAEKAVEVLRSELSPEQFSSLVEALVANREGPQR